MADSPFPSGAVDGYARLIERALSLPLPLEAPLADGACELWESAGLAVGPLATFERSDEGPRERVGERACEWSSWLGDVWARRWGPCMSIQQLGRERPDIARHLGPPRFVRVVAWSRGARWFGAGVYEPDADSSIHLMAFVTRIGPEDAPPGPPPATLAPSHRRYRPAERFAVGDHLDHPTFGAGRVVTVQGRSIEVEFATGRRKLTHDAR